MSSWVGNPSRPPYVIPRGSAGLKKKISPWSIGSVHFKFRLRRRLQKLNENQVHSPHGLLEREKGKGCVEGMEGGRERMNEELKGEGRGMRLVLGP